MSTTTGSAKGPPMTLPTVTYKLQHAKCGSDYLNGLIALHLGWQSFNTTSPWPFRNRPQWWESPDSIVYRALPAWTAGVDDALTLIPPECDFSITTGRAKPPVLYFGVSVFGEPSANEPICKVDHDGSLAIAICIAGLTARRIRLQDAENSRTHLRRQIAEHAGYLESSRRRRAEP